MSLEGAIAAHRFGLGARPGEIARASANPRAWLLDQIAGPAPQPEAPAGGFATAGRLVSEEDEYKVEKLKNKGNKAARREAEAKGTALPPKTGPANIRKETWFAEMGARLALGCTTDRPFAERLVRFWSNHFTVSTSKKKILMFVGSYERDAIRPHIAGTFEDMLFAVCMHPAMQIYLDNWHSIGPNSPAAAHNRKKGLNENLGRELMELYTLGVNGGYSQADVIAMAKLLTGWSVYDGRPDGFGFFEERHEPGAITLRGKTYPPGWDGSAAAVRDLAHDPATAHHIATKLAIHFIGDDPPKESVARLEQVFNDTGGNLHALSETLVKDPNAWHPDLRKFRPPVEYVTAAMRASGWNGGGERRDKQMHHFLGAVKMMGEVPFGAPSPKGWPDKTDDWAGSDALLDRIEWSKQFADGLPEANAARMADESLGPLLTANTKSVLAKAGSKSEAVALLLSSPEFQRR